VQVGEARGRARIFGYFQGQAKVSLSDRSPPADVVRDRPSEERPSLGGFGNPFAALRHRNFRIFYFGYLLSLSGTWLQITAIGWLVLELTDSEIWLGLVNAGTSLPILFFSLYAGVLADRLDKRAILIAAQSLALLQALTLAVLTHAGLINVHLILALALVLGVSNAFEIPTRQSFFVELVGERDLTGAIALNSSAFNATRMIGPAIAGVVISGIGIAACFYGNAISYVAVIGGLLAIRRSRPEPVPRTLSTWDHIGEGFTWIWRNPTARSIVIYVASASVFAFPFTMLLPVFARDLLQVGPQGLGWLFSASGGGALAAGLVLASLSPAIPRGRLLVFSATGFTILVGAFALSTSYLLSLALLTATGFFMILSTATANSLLQGLVPNELRGRVMSVYVVMFLGMTPVGFILVGVVAEAFGARVALTTGAVLLLGVLAIFQWRSPGLLRAV
jgi:MFS family permease